MRRADMAGLRASRARFALLLVLGALAAAALGGCALAPREAGVVITVTPDATDYAIATLRAESDATRIARPTQTPQPFSTTPPPAPGSYKVTGNLVIDGEGGKIYARGDAGEGERTLVFDAEDGALLDSFEPAGMLSIDPQARELLIDDVTSGLTVYDLTSGSSRDLFELPSLQRPWQPHMPSWHRPELCTVESMARYAPDVPPISLGEGRALVFRALEVLEVDTSAEGGLLRTMSLPEPCAGFIASAVLDAPGRRIYLTRARHRLKGMGRPDALFQVLDLSSGLLERRARQEVFSDPPSVVGSHLLNSFPEARYGLRPVMRVWKDARVEARIDRAPHLHFATRFGAGATEGRHWAAGFHHPFILSFEADSPYPASVGRKPGFGGLQAVHEELGIAVFLQGAADGMTDGHSLRVLPLADLLPDMDADFEPRRLVGKGWMEARSYRAGEDGQGSRIWLVAEARPMPSGRAAGEDRLERSDESCSAGGHGVLLSEDGGRTWMEPVAGWPCVAVHDLVDGPLRAQDERTVIVATELGVHRSEDGGRSWRPSSEGLGSFEILDLVATPDFDRGAPLFATGMLQFGLIDPKGLDTAWRSDDGGRTWSGIGPLRHLVLSSDYESSGRIHALHYSDDSVYLSEDRGMTWSRVGELPGEAVQALALRLVPGSDGDPDALLAVGGWHNQPGAYLYDGEAYAFYEHYVSRDEGRSWTVLPKPALDDLPHREVWASPGGPRDELIGPIEDGEGRQVLLRTDRYPMDSRGEDWYRTASYSRDDGDSWERLLAEPGRNPNRYGPRAMRILSHDGDRLLLQRGPTQVAEMRLDDFLEAVQTNRWEEAPMPIPDRIGAQAGGAPSVPR